MQELVREYLNELGKKQKKRRRINAIVAAFAVVIVGGVIWALVQSGIAMTGDPLCGKEEHTHSAECYSDVLVCGQEESAGHQHTDACYQTTQTLVCGQEESEEHTHSAECYAEERTLVCGQEESAGHQHTDACYAQQITCGKEEHTHTDACFIDTNADVEDAAQWDAEYQNTEWKETWGENLVIAAEKQIGNKESSKNYTVAEDGSHKGYTRYGQFMGDVYADWDAAFVNFCLHYAGLEETQMFPKEVKTSDWCEKFVTANEGNNKVYLTTPDGYEPQAGDIIFLKKENEETETQMGIVSSYDKEKNEIKVIEGNSGNEVKENKYSTDDKHITEYLKIAEMEEAYKAKGSEEVPEENGTDETDTTEASETDETQEKRIMKAEGPDYTVEVSFTEEAGIPENAELKVREIKEGDEEYEEYYEKSLKETNAESLEVSRYFDIAFLVDGEEIEPSDSVEVRISADEIETDQKDRGRILHFTEDGTETIDFDVDEEESAVSFVANSFSTYSYALVRSIDLHTENTVDSTEKGINIRMINYSGVRIGENGYSKFSPFTEAVGDPCKGILGNRLQSNGYPNFTGTRQQSGGSNSKLVYLKDAATGAYINNRKSLRDYFVDAKPANNLFLNTVYENQGYFEYDSSENAAVYDETSGKFTVYEELITPVSKADNKDGGDDSNPNFKRGNFLPYDTFLNGNDSKQTDGKGRTLYLPDAGSKNADYHFGMEMSTTFYMGKDSKDDRNNDIIYEFRGDDDLWVYIDGVLVLDLGGCHGIVGGTINFTTGEVTVTPEKSGASSTTLYQIFSKMHEEGELTDEEFDEIEWKTLDNGKKIFADYSSHTFNMWYMERGEGASNLHLKCNLPTVPKGTVQIQKKLVDSDGNEFENEEYANVEFGFQVYLQPIVGEVTSGNNDKFDDNAQPEEYRLLCQELVNLHRTTAEAYKILQDGKTRQPIDIPSAGVASTQEAVFGIPNNDTTKAVFYLKPGETLVLSGLKMNRNYYVREVSASSDRYDHVYVGNSSVDFTGEGGGPSTQGDLRFGTGADNKYYVRTVTRTVSKRTYVVFKNQCTTANDRKLEITKQMKEGQESEDTFSFEVSLESQTNEEGIVPGHPESGVLKPYSGKYYLKNPSKKWVSKTGEEADEIADMDSETRKAYEYETTNGKISGVGVGYTVVIDHVLSDTKFVVKEADLTGVYDLPEISDAEPESYEQLEGNNAQEAHGQILLNQDAKVLVSNSYKINHEWLIKKKSSSQSSDGTKRFLENAKFKLSPKNSNAITNGSEGENIYYGLSDDEGILTWYKNEACEEKDKAEEGIAVGEYQLEELYAPAGYAKSDIIWNIQVKDNNEVEITNSDGEKVTYDTDNQDRTEIQIFYYDNTPIYSLPEAGGSGIYWYMLSGILLMAGAALITYKKRCREVLKS